MHMHVHAIYCLMTSTITTYAHTQTICGGSDCPVGFIWNSVVSHAVCSVLRSSFPQGGLVQDKHLIWLGPCFLLHNHGSSFLNSLDLSFDRQGSFPLILKQTGMTEGFIHLFSLQPKWPRNETIGSQQQKNTTVKCHIHHTTYKPGFELSGTDKFRHHKPIVEIQKKNVLE